MANVRVDTTTDGYVALTITDGQNVTIVPLLMNEAQELATGLSVAASLIRSQLAPKLITLPDSVKRPAGPIKPA